MSDRKMRKCNQCGAAMAVKKGGKGRFWACTRYRDGCANTAEFHGYSPKAGLDLDIRSIENGYIVLSSYKYAEDVDDEESVEVYCKDEDDLRSELTKMFAEKIDDLMSRLSLSGDYFVEEPDDTPIKVQKQKASTDIRDLMKKVNKGRRQVKDED